MSGIDFYEAVWKMIQFKYWVCKAALVVEQNYNGMQTTFYTLKRHKKKFLRSSGWETFFSPTSAETKVFFFLALETPL